MMFPTLLVVSALVAASRGDKILAVFAMSAKSHYTLGFRLAKELADRGHEVTFISAFPQKEPIKNLREISVAEIREDIGKIHEELYDMGRMSYIGQIAWVSGLGNFCSDKVLQVEEVQRLLRSDEQFDLLLTENFMSDAMAIFQHKFDCPSVLLAPGPTTVFNNHLFANPSQPSYVPNSLAKLGSRMTLWERIRNVYYDVVGELYVQLVIIPTQNEILQRNVPGAPNLRDILYNVSFLLLTSHISIRDPFPLQPNIKEIGGYHLSSPKPLPTDIQKFLDDAKEGVIVFSMGSILKSSEFPDSKRQTVLKVFSGLKQKVLWKYESDLPEKPENVKILNWMPQQDVLAHPNVVAFISHGGLLGKIEAVYHGVPTLTLPVFWDQERNSYEAVRHGYALSVPFQKLTEENFAWALNELINNTKYKDNIKMRSRIMRDQPIKQIDEAVFWIEYVIRHKGAPHYRSPALNLKWYQRLLLDVILVLSIIILTIFAVIFCLAKRIFYSLNANITKKFKGD